MSETRTIGAECELAEHISRTLGTIHLFFVQAQGLSAERAILRTFCDSEVMLELYLASECSSRDLVGGLPHLRSEQVWLDRR